MSTKTIIFILLSVVISNLISCGSTSLISIKTIPDKADIFLRKVTSSVRTKIGVSPLTMTADEIIKKHNIQGPVILEFSKVGYHTRTALITDIQVREIDIMIQLQPQDHLLYSEKINKIANDLFECQKLVRKKQYRKAMLIITNIKKEFPYLSVVYEMEGGILLIQKKFDRALDSFTTAVKHNPKNLEALRMKKELEKKLKIRGRRL